ncbi:MULTISPECIES: glycogen debranching N-terminal domain-containing protein [Arthrobacter]|uniref:Amylo-alpha-1,6-glucosidase n=1 Tax=Arthrobacter terricola TaxID=2547396 RepID=A0A4R5KKK0_9MICC|nr:MULTISPECIES: glycogen debranching N-terminal domain-containing protein [Arthrobacter]MBT8161313.1 amylo-alpha-1,6-glucosidase [Arthrobacter sp. GN70]TDF96091.1 amylo-alpha-1,6-glucosidase [Arthrobacter terricola]
MAGWNADTAAGPVGAGTITLVEGSSFCISSANGDIHPEQPHGVFHEDTRILSRWNLTVNGQRLEALTAETKEPYRALFIGRVPRSEGYADSHLIVERLREVGGGIVEEITVRNYSTAPAECTVDIGAESDFADLFEVKEARVQRRWKESRVAAADSLTISAEWHDVRKGIVVTGGAAAVGHDGLRYLVLVPPHGEWSTTLRVAPFTADKAEPAGRFATQSAGELSPSDRRRQEWVAKIPKLHMGNRSIERTLRRSYDDLGALRIEDPAHPERIVVAAGAPWFMTLFGRDSLWASEMALPVDPSLALGTLQTLAERQGKVVDPMSEEEPGKILHEVRLGVSTGLALGGKSVYYGSVDATPQFVMTLGSVSRWGFAKDTIAALLPHADRALDWVRTYGDKDGDGFVEYARLNDQGLINQGWKDSWDGINFADGTLAEPPIALCEVQALVYTALLSRAWMAYDAGDAPLAARLTEEAAQLKNRFNEQFWLPDRGYFAVALDGRKRPVDACASNMGQCLWHGIIDDDKVPLVVERLMSPEMFSGWGVRTLASNMGAYNPASYHNGSVWPHDNAIIAAGLVRYGFIEEAQRIATALLEAADYSNGRLPELFCGFDREQLAEPVPYPTACSPQAWAATTPIMLVTSLMRYDAHVSRGGFWMDPVLPESYGDLHITNAPMAGGRMTIDITGSEPTVQGLPEGIVFHREHRPWLTELVAEAGLGKTQ